MYRSVVITDRCIKFIQCAGNANTARGIGVNQCWFFWIIPFDTESGCFIRLAKIGSASKFLISGHINISSKSPQLINLWWMSNSICIGFGTVMRTGSSRRFKRYPTTYIWVSSLMMLIKFMWIKDYPGLS